MQRLADSSRFWSADDGLEHLVIVTRAVEQVILSLASGTVPKGTADIAKVKPRGFVYSSPTGWLQAHDFPF